MGRQGPYGIDDDDDGARALGLILLMAMGVVTGLMIGWALWR